MLYVNYAIAGNFTLEKYFNQAPLFTSPQQPNFHYLNSFKEKYETRASELMIAFLASGAVA